jgi:predicted dehydrogenase
VIRTAIIGLGKVAEQIHIPACQAVDEIQIVGASEPNAERRQAMQARFNLPKVYEDSYTLIEKEQPELVIIGTPPDSHKEFCLLALRNGADVMCEKPFVLTLAEADEVIAEAKRNHRLLAVNTQYRYMKIYKTARDRIAGGEFGRLFFLQCWQQMFHPPAFEKGSWRTELKQSTLYEFGSHPLDLICDFFDALPTAVTAHIPQVSADYNSDVLVQMTLRFPNERLATLVFNRVSHAPERYLEMRLDCDRASLRLSFGGVARASIDMTRYQGRNRLNSRFSFVKGGEARVEFQGRSHLLAREMQPAQASATAAHLRSFLAARRGSDRSHQAAEYARNILKIIFAGYESAKTGQTVEL